MLFMESQGYPTHPTKLYKENMSTIFLGKNGKASSIRGTSHIDMRYLFASIDLRLMIMVPI